MFLETKARLKDIPICKITNLTKLTLVVVELNRFDPLELS